MANAGIRSVTVLRGDSLEDLARRFMGDASQWRTLAAFNKLRYPYISDDPRDYYGIPISSGLVPVSLAAGATAVPLVEDPVDAPHTKYVDIGGVLLLIQYDRKGKLSWDPLIVSAYDPVAGQIVVQGASASAYDAGASWYLYPHERPRSVLRTGDQIIVPIGDPAAIRPTDRLVDLLGTDIAIDDFGGLSWSIASTPVGVVAITASPAPAVDRTLPAGTAILSGTGLKYLTAADATIAAANPAATVAVRAEVAGSAASVPAHDLARFADPGAAAAALFPLYDAAGATLVDDQGRPLGDGTTVVFTVDNVRPIDGFDGTGDLVAAHGMDNLRQAVVHRLSTRKAALPYAPDYGNEAFEAIGLPNQYVQAALFEASIITCVEQDDRVAQVTAGQLVRTTDALALSIDVAVKGADSKFILKELQLSFLT